MQISSVVYVNRMKLLHHERFFFSNRCYWRNNVHYYLKDQNNSLSTIVSLGN